MRDVICCLTFPDVNNLRYIQNLRYFFLLFFTLCNTSLILYHNRGLLLIAIIMMSKQIIYNMSIKNVTPSNNKLILIKAVRQKLFR